MLEESFLKGKIIEKKEKTPVEVVYDLTVEDNHNLFINHVLCSNCHHIAADTFVQVSKWASNAYYRVGVSATPWREDGADLLIEASLSRLTAKHNISASFLIEKGFLTPCTIYFVPIKETFKGKTYDALYKNAIVNNSKRNLAACKIALRMQQSQNATTLILINQVQHGRNVFKLLGQALAKKGVLKVVDYKETKNSDGTLIDRVPVFEGKRIQVVDPLTKKTQLVKVCELELLTGEDSALRRAAVIEGVKKGIVKILIGSTIADEGLDIPNLDCLILLSAGKSSTKAFQRIGRVIRTFVKKDDEGNVVYEKKKAVVFDFDDATPLLQRHSNARLKMYRTEPLWTIKKFDLNLLK